MHDTIKKEAAKHGFHSIYFLPAAALTQWKTEEETTGVAPHLEWDMAAAYPKATCFILAVFPYAPFDENERISAYYLASQKSYFAAKAFAAAIAQSGAYCEPANVPARALALSHGIGSAGKNGLLRLPGFGTRIVLHVLATNACMPLPQTAAPLPCPPGCTACRDACPFGAIGNEGLCVMRCMRYHMQGPQYPEAVYEKLRTHMGCEVCQHACPYNAALLHADPDAATRDAFSLERLICGDTGAARTLVGRNMTGKGKLTAEAIYFAGKEGLFEDAIRKAYAESPFDAVKQAAETVLQRNFNKK